MKEEHLLVAFVVFVSAVFLALWVHFSQPSLQFGGALYGIPGTDPISPFMAGILVIWLILVGFVVYVSRRH